MRVCLASLHPRVLSGQIDSLTGLGRALVRRGTEVTLVAPFDTGALLNGALAELDTGPTRLLPAARQMLGAIPRVVQASRGCDLVHLALPTPAFGWLGNVVQARVAAPVLVGFEGHLVDTRELFKARRRSRAWRSLLILWAVNNRLFGRLRPYRCRAYVVSSHYQRDELIALGAPVDRVVVLPNMVEESKLAGCAPRVARRCLGLQDCVPVVGYVGHFNDGKGVDVLAAAFRALSERLPSATLALAWSGQGDPRPIQQRLAGLEARVTWLRKVHVGTFLSAIDVLALPYRSTAGQAAFPSLLLEALHARRSLVTTDLPLLREVTSLGPVALNCPPERPDLLAERLELLLRSEEQRRAMSEAQGWVVQTHFASQALVQRYEQLYTSMLEVNDVARLAA